MLSRVRPLPAPPPALPPFPDWVRASAPRENSEEASFLAGAALAAIHPIARLEHPLGTLWRRRLALASAAALSHLQGRSEDAAALRDHFYLTRTGDDPGPAARLLAAWRELGEHPTAGQAPLPPDWLPKLADFLSLGIDKTAQEAIEAALAAAATAASPIAAAAGVAATTLRVRPDGRPLALWLANAALARRLKWPSPVPLLAAHLKRDRFRLAAGPQADKAAWQAACALAYALGAAAAYDLHADLVRRAERLLAIAPKLRGRDAGETVQTLLSEDAHAAQAGKSASARSSRRLFERLVELGAVRELTGRPTFRLYGL
jgi:hypothetical protein